MSYIDCNQIIAENYSGITWKGVSKNRITSSNYQDYNDKDNKRKNNNKISEYLQL